MGWSWTYSPGMTTKDVRQACDALHTWGTDGVGLRVLKSAMVGSTYYAAVERRHADGRADVSASVCLTRRAKGEWGYKGMDEAMGPNESKCPAGILNLLSPTESEYALEWRKRCRANLAKPKAAWAAGVKVQYGDHEFVLDAPAGPRLGWLAWRTGGGRYRLTERQLSQAKAVP